MTNVDLCLPKSRIRLRSDILQVCGRPDEVIAHHPISAIKSLSVEKHFEPVALLFGFVGAGAIYFSLGYIDHTQFRFTLVGLGCVFVLLGLLGAVSNRLVVYIDDTRTSYPVNDLIEHAQGFAISVNHLINSLKEDDSNSLQKNNEHIPVGAELLQ